LWKSTQTEQLEKHTHARLLFVSGEELRFVDPRTFGELWLSDPSLPEMSHIGPDALDGVATPADLAARFAGRTSVLKSLLLNQQVVAGIGNIYSDEMLWHARLRYSRRPDSLTHAAVARLHGAMKFVLREAVAHRGSSLSDQQYVDLYGNTGSAQLALNAYAREHLPCPRCEHPIKRLSFGGRSTFFCPHCQR
jgi:formamidopyrimidine-DNA glycosylase